jgi:hypothetical protein
MMGGDQDCSAKAVMGIHASDNDVYLLIVVRLHYTAFIYYFVKVNAVLHFISLLFNGHAYEKLVCSKHRLML